MIVDLVIKNCKIVSPWSILQGGGVAIDQEKIVMVAQDHHLPQADTTIDGRNQYLLPGIIEPHTHLAYGSTEMYTDQVRTETGSAACGGVTTFFTKLPRQGLIMSIENLQNWTDANAIVDMSFHVGIGTQDHVNRIPEYVQAGLPSLKFHMQGHPMFGVLDAEDDIIWGSFEKASQLVEAGYPCVLMFHTANYRIVQNLTQKFQKQGRDDVEAYLASRPSFHEEEGMRRVLTFGRQFSKVPIYIVHVSIAAGPPIIAKARSEGLQVYGETLPQLMTHTIADFPNTVLADPYPRTKEDNLALWQGFHTNGIHALGTDHEVSHKTEFAVPKTQGFWEETGAGAPGTETMLSVMLNEGVHKNRITLPQLVQLMCLQPAQIFSIFPKKGIIQPGSDADLVLVDLSKKQKVTSDLLHSAGDASFYDGWTLQGWPILTVSRGTIVMRDGTLLGKPGHGQAIFRKRSPQNSLIP